MSQEQKDALLPKYALWIKIWYKIRLRKNTSKYAYFLYLHSVPGHSARDHHTETLKPSAFSFAPFVMIMFVAAFEDMYSGWSRP